MAQQRIEISPEVIKALRAKTPPFRAGRSAL